MTATDDPQAWLDAVDARVSAATPGPWSAHSDLYSDTAWRYVYANGSLFVGDNGYPATCSASDADLIAHAPATLAAMSAALRAVLALDYIEFDSSARMWNRAITAVRAAIAEHLGGDR